MVARDRSIVVVQFVKAEVVLWRSRWGDFDVRMTEIINELRRGEQRARTMWRSTGPSRNAGQGARVDGFENGIETRERGGGVRERVRVIGRREDRKRASAEASSPAGVFSTERLRCIKLLIGAI
jgi:hypothetical protein